MKTKVILTAFISAVALSGAAAQSVEYDDMYFNAGDRAELRAARQAERMTLASNEMNRGNDSEQSANPTDSYSARTINPEYTSRSESQSASADEEDYYVPNYHNPWNNNFNSWYGSSWYRPNFWNSSIYGWHSPFYGSAYGAWGNPYYPYGWGSSFSFQFGNSWNYGWGWNNYWDSYYGGWSPYYGYGWGGYYGGYYPTRVVVINDDDRLGAAYGKRHSRSSQIKRDTHGSTRSGDRVSDAGRDRGNSGGRSAGRLTTNTSRDRSEYYDNNWRDNSRSTGTTSYSNPSRPDSDESRTRSSWESQNRTNTRSYSPPPSRSFDSGRSSSGSSDRSTGSSSGSSGSRSSRSRGGN